MKEKPIPLRRENGKCITIIKQPNGRIAVIVWKKNGAPLLPLIFDSDEALQFSEELAKAAA